ncbi:Mob1/phocein [Serendipita vermifera]|nr:Mob1/phocein [Serendipita vermifera]
MAAEVSAPVAFPSTSPRRVQRGARYSAVEATLGSGAQGSPPSLYSLDSAFQLQEYIAQLVRRNPEDIDAIVKLPSGQASQHDLNDPSTSVQDGPEVDQSCWVYEHLRRLAQDLTSPLITLLQVECTRQSCPEMKAGEWLYLCVAHGNGNAMEQCCAIDYILHTLDSATALLNSSRTFPSRIAIPMTSTKHFASLARRLSRIFAHAYFHHRELFEQAEAENALYERFLGLVQEFQLVPAEYLVINWEDRPTRKSRGDLHHDQSHAYEGVDYEGGGAQSRTILTREGSGSGSTDDAALMASPSGGALGRRRTDTMYMTGDLLAALDPVLSGGADEATFDAAAKEFMEESHAEEKAEEDTEAEMVESVDPFKDENEVPPAAEELSHPVGSGDDYEVLGDNDVVPDVEDVVVPSSNAKSDHENAEAETWPDTEVLDQEAAQASAEGQSSEDIVPEPNPTPTSEEGENILKDSEEQAEPKQGEEEAKSETEKATPEDNDVVNKMLKDLEEERMVKLGFTSPTEES